MKSKPGNKHSRFTVDLSAYLDGLYSYAVVLSRNRAEAEELVQETCLRAMERPRPDSNIKSWLFTILRNIWLNPLRQSRAAPEGTGSDVGENSASQVVDRAEDPYATHFSNIDRERVQHAIQQLTLEFREIILLREYEQLSYEEIAKLLDCPLGTAMLRLARARARLRDLLMAISPPPKENRS
jgi:RNA polymerase sigma-70 factor, ECF subfamily